ncbi:MAG TPA: Flp family type IVb pilin [Chloroflexota bacterium]|nr:Flp family type IVb pilin [Chloroflexota bacterium]
MWFPAVSYYVRLALQRLEQVEPLRGPAQRGQSMVEYAIVAALIAVVAMTAVQAMGTGIEKVFQNIVSKIQNLGS